MSTTPPPPNASAASREPEDQRDDLEMLMDRARSAPRGTTRSNLWAQAASLAEERGDLQTAVDCYLSLALAYQTGGDYTRAIAPVAWLDRTYREHPEAFSNGQVQLWAQFYPTTITAMTLLPTVSVSQLEQFLERMRELYRQLGDTLRAVSLAELDINETLGNAEAADAALTQWETTPRGDLCSSLASEMITLLPYYRERQQWTTATNMGEAALVEEHEDRFVADPLFNELMVPWLYAGKDDLAWAAHVRTYRKWQQSPYDAQYLPEQVLYLALSGQVGRPSRLERGLAIFRRHLPWFTEFETPRDLQLFAIAGAVLLGALPPERAQEQLHGTLPGDSLEWAHAPRLDNPTISQARHWCEDVARSLAQSFAARPGHPHPEVEMRRLEEWLNPELPPQLSPESEIPDVTGLSGQLVVDSSSGPSTLRTTGIGGVSAAQDEQQEEEPLTPVDVRGPWREASVDELIAAEATYGVDADAIYGLSAKQRMMDRSESPDQWPEFHQQDGAASATGGQGSPEESYIRLRLAIEAAELRGLPEEQLTVHRVRLAAMGCDKPTSIEPAYTLLEPAQEHMDQGQFQECAQLCHQSLYAETTEPIGARLCAWLLMGRAAQQAGYLQEAIAPLRDCVNLSAACAITHFRMLAAGSLAEVLLDLKRPAEAADLLQGCLDELSTGQPLPEVLLNANFDVARAAADLGHSGDAGHYFEQVAESVEEPRQRRKLTAIAIQHFENAQQYGRAIALAQRAVSFQEARLEQAHMRWASVKESAEPTETIEAAEQDYFDQQVNLSDDLQALASLIAKQPGPASDEERAVVELTLDRVRELVMNTELGERWGRSRQWREAMYLRQASHVWFSCHSIRTGMDYASSAAEAFAALGDEQMELLTLISKAAMLLQVEDISEARALVEEIRPRVTATKYVGTDLRYEFDSLVANLKQY
ncbi:hypothetical protein CCICO_08635 [Corynebacterium ciconiae DSM 44920]|uniref:hypothetical protein n=1 Tax=Corynebacterium ciconiae TaxID=227319 RepID=UPI0003666B31|nr:hypothetical protein [Corynebacterium ciconiae]WKD61736.1 hypothetical protein CCICO_08635 [Corynebacterium ciconiae DSM 44920]